MTFRVKFVDPDGTWWTGPLLNYADAALLVSFQRRSGLVSEIHVESRALREKYAQLLAGSFAEQQATGQPQTGVAAFGCPCGKCDFHLSVQIVREPARPAGGPLPPGEHPGDCQCTVCVLQREMLKLSIQPTFPAVFGVWPLLEAGACNTGSKQAKLQQAKCEPCDCDPGEEEELWEPREFAPPTAEEFAAHTPLRQIQPLLPKRPDPWWVSVTDFLDRVGSAIVRAILAPRGTLARKQPEAAPAGGMR